MSPTGSECRVGKMSVQAIKNLPASGAGATTAHPKGVEHTMALQYHCRSGLVMVTKPDIEGKYNKSTVKVPCIQTAALNGVVCKYSRARMCYKGLPGCLGTQNRVFLCLVCLVTAYK